MTTCYAALEDRLLVVDGPDGDPTASERLIGTETAAVAVASERPDRPFVGTVDDGLQRGTEGGHAWETVLDAGDRVTAVTVSPHDPGVVWAGTEPSAVYRSTDGGDTWERRPGLTDLPSAANWSFPPRPHTHHVRWIAVAPEDPDRVYVVIEAGALVRSTDAGRTWIDHPSGARRDNHTLATHPAAPGRVYAAAGDGYAESIDGGETWRHPEAGLDHRYVWGLAVDPRDPDRVVVSAASGPRSAHDPDGTAHVYRRSADGWDRVTAGLPGPEGMARPVLAADDSGFYALTNHGLYHADRGDEWDLVPLAWPADYARQVPRALAIA